MVDAVGSRPVTNERPVVKVSPAEPVRAATTTGSTATANGVGTLTSVAAGMAASAPVDTDRVAQIRKAVQDGTFPILPAKIADRLIAFSMQWNPHDQA